jgi:hypothetical protein
MLCAQTRDEIAERMTEVLGDNYFTLVTCNSYDENSHKFSSVDVSPSQWLTRPVRADGGDYQGISWGTPRYSMGVSTKAETQTDGRNGGPHKYVHFTFEHDRVVIDHYAPARYWLRWILAVERHDRDED